MSGREENEMKIKNRIEKKLQCKPKYLYKYYRSMSKKTYKTKYVYLTYVIEFIDYLPKIDIYINEQNDFSNIVYSDLNYYISYLYEKGNKESIIASKMYAIKNFFEYLKKDKIISYNPCVDVEIPEVNKEPDVISLNEIEIQTVLNNIEQGVGNDKSKSRQKLWKSRDKALFLLGITNGLRVTAISEINISDINFKDMTITVIEKGNIQRTCFLPTETMKAINDWIIIRNELLGDYYCDALFISNRKTRLTSRSIEVLIKKYTYNIDKKITPHKLRSTCATNIYQKSGDIYLTADIIGHRNIQNTRKYAGISVEQKQKAANIMDNLIKSCQN